MEVCRALALHTSIFSMTFVLADAGVLPARLKVERSEDGEGMKYTFL
jgi:hypothetical protein